MIKAAIFDLDGTILDTLDDLANSVNAALEAGDMPKRSREEIRRFVGNGTSTLISRAVPKGTSEEVRMQTWKTFTEIYAKEKNHYTQPYEGITACVKRLINEGTPCAVLSNKDDDAVRELCDQYFPSVFTACQGRLNDMPPKPDPTMLLALCDRLGICAQEAAYIGDSEVDVQTADNAGMPLVGVTWGFRNPAELKASGCRLMVDNPQALYDTLQAMIHQAD